MRWVPTPKLQLGRQDTLVCGRSYLGYIRSNLGASTQIAEAIFLRNGDYSDRASQLLATFCNLMLSGLLRSQFWLCTRSVLVPKKNGDPRLLGIGDSWHRFVGRIALSKVGERVGSALSPV